MSTNDELFENGVVEAAREEMRIAIDFSLSELERKTDALEKPIRWVENNETPARDMIGLDGRSVYIHYVREPQYILGIFENGGCDNLATLFPDREGKSTDLGNVVLLRYNASDYLSLTAIKGYTLQYVEDARFAFDQPDLVCQFTSGDLVGWRAEYWDALLKSGQGHVWSPQDIMSRQIVDNVGLMHKMLNPFSKDKELDQRNAKAMANDDVLARYTTISSSLSNLFEREIMNLIASTGGVPYDRYRR